MLKALLSIKIQKIEENTNARSPVTQNILKTPFYLGICIQTENMKNGASVLQLIKADACVIFIVEKFKEFSNSASVSGFPSELSAQFQYYELEIAVKQQSLIKIILSWIQVTNIGMTVTKRTYFNSFH